MNVPKETIVCTFPERNIRAKLACALLNLALHIAGEVEFVAKVQRTRVQRLFHERNQLLLNGVRQHGRVGITQHRKQTKIGGKIYGRVENAGHTLPVRDDNQKVARMQRDHTEDTVHDKLLLILGHLLAYNNG